MKHCLKSIIPVLALVFSLALLLVGCGNDSDMSQASGAQDDSTTYLIDYSLKFNSYEELAQAKAEAAENGYKDDLGDINNLEGLNYYYVPVYAEKNWEFTKGRVYDIRIAVEYNENKPENDNVRSEFVLSVSRLESGKERLARTIDPPIPYEGSPKPWTVEGVYYTEPIYSASLSTYFYWVQDNNFCTLTISADLMKQIEEKDPEALKGPLFELQKVELK